MFYQDLGCYLGRSILSLKPMKILSLQIGQPKDVDYDGKTVSTGYFKKPVSGALRVRALGIEGDGQADLKVHGGRDKAVYAFPFDAYAPWSLRRPQDQMSYGIFGENITTDRLPENEIYLGDAYQVGSCVLQVTEPRFPCFKLGIRFGDPRAIKEFNDLARPGVYYRVLVEGSIEAGERFKLIDREKEKVSVLEVFKHSPVAPDFEMLDRALKLKSLNERWREKFSKAILKRP